MSATTPALIAAAAGVGFGHAVLPDHWLPLALVGRTRRYPPARVARLSGLAGISHVLVSLLLGGVIVAVGLQFRSTVERSQNAIVGGLLMVTGAAFLVVELRGRGHDHSHTHGHAHGDAHDDPHPPGHAEAQRRAVGRVAGIVVPFGAAASPDLTILPVFLAATAVGTGTAIGALVAFAAATVSTIVALTLVAAFGGYRLRGAWLERWGNAVTAGTLIVIGALVAGGAI